MASERGARSWTITGKEIDDTFGKAGFKNEFAHTKRGKWSLLRGLQDDGAAGGESGTEFPRLHQQRKIPRNDLTDDANRLVFCVAEIAALHGNGFALDLVGPSGVVAITGDGERQISGARNGIGLAVIERFELGKFVGVLFDQFSEFVKKIAALRGSDFFAPRTIVECGASGGDGFVDIGGIGFSDVGDWLSSGWVDSWKSFAGGGCRDSDEVAGSYVRIAGGRNRGGGAKI